MSVGFEGLGDMVLGGVWRLDLEVPDVGDMQRGELVGITPPASGGARGCTPGRCASLGS